LRLGGVDCCSFSQGRVHPWDDNTLGGPIYLLPLSETGLFVSETTGGTLTLPDVPGFSLSIEPGSVTFADGSHAGIVSATQIHYDEVPIVPRLGLEPDLVVTIQPPGARFDPPAPVSFPNTGCKPPGTQVDLFSFDQDLEQFVSIGPGTIWVNGLTVGSNPGVGVVKAGWHDWAAPGSEPAGGGEPSCRHDCGNCKNCLGGACREAPEETAEQVEDNCRMESCSENPDPIDLSDVPDGMQCCANPALPQVPASIIDPSEACQWYD